MNLSPEQLKEFLEEKYVEFDQPSFIESDPISIPHQFDNKEDIEISAFLTATIAWGKRSIIIRNAQRLVDLMDREPHQFLLHAGPAELSRFDDFVHRTFNGIDCRYFIERLSQLYLDGSGLEGAFAAKASPSDIDTFNAICGFRELFFAGEHPARTQKHVSNPAKGASAKRLNMFLRWMVRSNRTGVDFGLWTCLTPAQLSMPLDVHTGNVARKLGLLERKQNDWKAVAELDANLRKMDATDPVKYDFALFGLGVFEGF